MTTYSAILLLGAGYLSGLSVASGLLLSALRNDLANRGSTLALKLWPIAAVGNWVLAIFGFSLVFALAVFGDRGGDFFANGVLFGIGVILGGALVVYVGHRMDQRYKIWKGHS